MGKGMEGEGPRDMGKPGRAGALRTIDAAEKAVLEATARCSAESLNDLRVADRYLGIARRRFLLQDWDGARIFSRLAIESAEQVTRDRIPAPSVLNPPDGS